jgi:hypothetical protein
MKRHFFIVLLLLALSPAAFGQGCAVCTKTAQGYDDKSATGLNGGIIYLAFLPIAMIGTVGFGGAIIK